LAAGPSRPDPGGAEPREVARARIAEPAEPSPIWSPRSSPCWARRPCGWNARLPASQNEPQTWLRSATPRNCPSPRARWQGADPADPALFASLVDLAPALDHKRRAGIEAACEAAGLLSSAVRADGSVVSASGELLVTAGAPVMPNVTSVLVPVAPEDAGVDTATVARALASVGLGAASAAALWAADDGRFGAGPLRGRHSKFDCDGRFTLTTGERLTRRGRGSGARRRTRWPPHATSGRPW
jgi:hypothetical protein